MPNGVKATPAIAASDLTIINVLRRLTISFLLILLILLNIICKEIRDFGIGKLVEAEDDERAVFNEDIINRISLI